MKHITNHDRFGRKLRALFVVGVMLAVTVFDAVPGTSLAAPPAKKGETTQTAPSGKKGKTTDAGKGSSGKTTDAGKGQETAGQGKAAAALKDGTADIENNGGYFVRCGDYIYFRVYGPDALPKTALWGEFMQPVSGGSSAIWRLNLKTNQYEELFDDGGYGGLWFFQDRLWLSRMTELGNIVYTVDLETYQKNDLDWGSIMGISTDGSHLVYESYADNGQKFYVTGEEDMDHVVSATDGEFLTYCGAVGRDLFFLSHTYGSDKEADELWQLASKDGTEEAELILLGTFPEAENGGVAEFVQFLADDERVYVSVEYREGTGHFYAGSHYVEAVPGREDSMKLLDKEAEKAWDVMQEELAKANRGAKYAYETDPETMKMYIDRPGRVAFALHLPGELDVREYEEAEACDLILYDSPEILRPEDAAVVFEGWIPKFEYTDEKVPAVHPQVMEFVDGKAFTICAESLRDAENDIGWRAAFELVRTNYEYYDMADTGSDARLDSGVKTGGAKTGGDAKTGGSAGAGGAKTGGAKTGGAKAGSAKAGGAKAGTAKTGSAEADASDTGAARFIESVEAGRDLTEKEIGSFNKKFDSDYCGFALSDYHDPTQINWDEVLYNGAGISTSLSNKQIEEYLKQVGLEELYTDVTAVRGKDLREFVKRMTGSSYEDAEHPLSWDYLKKDDLYVFMHGDTNYQPVEFVSGWDLGNDTYRLHYMIHAPGSNFDSWPYKMTVRIKNDQWVFLSNLPE